MVDPVPRFLPVSWSTSMMSLSLRIAHELDGLMAILAGALAMWLASSFETPSG